MNRTEIERRLQELSEMRLQQRERLARAQQEQRDAMASLERIEGAAQDCAFWLTKIQEATERLALAHAETNGEIAAVAGERN